MNKEAILQKIAQQLENNIQELSNSLEDYRAASDMDEGDTLDPDDYSRQAEKKEMQYQMQIQLDQAEARLNQLKQYSVNNVSMAKAGALVETDKNWFLLGVSFPALKVGDKDLLGISPESPAFAAINNKSEGDEFKLGQYSHTIINIM